MLNPEKCKCIILPKISPGDLFVSINSVQVPIVDLLGVTIDSSLNFSKITKKVGKQFDVLSRLKNMQSISTKICLLNSNVMSYFTYCSAICLNCNKSEKQKVERFNARALPLQYMVMMTTI